MQASGTRSKRIAKGVFRTILGIVLIVPLLACFLYLMLQAGWLNPLIRYTGVRIANNVLDAKFSVESIHGNPLKHIEIAGIKLRKDDSTIARIGSVTLDFDISQALHKRFTVNEILVDSLHVAIEQLPDSTWNLQHIARPSEPKPKVSEASSIPLDLYVALHSLRITNTNFDIRALDPRIPSEVRDFDLDFGFSLVPGEIYAVLRNVSFATDDMRLNTLQAEATIKDSSYVLHDFLFETDRSKITANGTYQNNVVNLRLRAFPFDLRDVQAFRPAIKHPDQYSLYCNIESDGTKLQGSCSVWSGENKLGLNILMPEYPDMNHATLSLSSYDLDLSQDWDVPLSSRSIGVRLESKDGMIPDGEAEIKIDATAIQYDSFRLETIWITLGYSPEGQTFDIQLIRNLSSSLSMKGDLNFFDPLRPFEMDGRLSLYSISEIPFDLQTRLNYSARGELRSFTNLKADFDIDLLRCSLGDYRIDSGKIALGIDDGNYELKHFDFRAIGDSITGSGYGNFEGPHHIDFEADLSDISKLRSIAGLDELAGSVHLSAHADGMPDSLGFSAKVNTSDLEVNDLTLEQLRLNADGTFIDRKIDADCDILLRDLGYNDISLDSLALDASYRDEELRANLNLRQNNARYGSLRAVYRPGEIELPMLDFHLDGDHWLLVHDSTKVLFDTDRYAINDFSLVSPPQRIAASGFYQPNGPMDVLCVVDSLDLSILNGFLSEDNRAEGTLDLDIALRGSMDHPDANAKLRLTDLVWEPYHIAAVDADISTIQDVAKVRAAVRFTTEKQITLDASAPLGRFLRNIPLTADSLITLRVESDSIDIGFLNEYTDQIAFEKGHLVMDIEAKSDTRHHDVEGRIKLTGKSLTVRQLNTRYEDLFLELSGDNSAIRLDTLFAEGGDGTLSATGSIELGNMKEEFVESFDIKLLAKQFQFSRRRQMRLVSDMDIGITGNLEKPLFDADVRVIESRIDIDRFTGGSGPALPSQKPLLVEAMTDTSAIQYRNPKTDIKLSKTISGTARIRIPRNSWVYGKDMQIEFSGDLKAVKEGENLYLTGTVSTIRGYYNLYGRKFTIDETVVTFTGGKEIDPILNVTAKYAFRDINENRRTLSVVLTGRSTDPQAIFLLDGQQIEQADAVSYIIFQRSTRELTQNEKSSMNENSSSSSFAQGLLIKQLSSQLTRSIQENLDLDVLEIQGDQDLTRTSIIVGKYLTNRLFLSYERKFDTGSTSDSEIEILTLEYQINRAFSIQATRGNDSSTGMDLIWKYEK